MTFLDMQQMRQVGSPAPSPDGKWLLYTLSTPDWKEAKRQTDIYLVSLQQGVSSTRQMTFTKEKNETAPRWARDGSFFVFPSNRDAPENAASRNQLYMMRPDGGEARRITDAKEGVSRLRVQPRRRVARLSQRQGGRGAAVSAARRRHRDGDGGTAHQASDRRRARGSGRPTAQRIYFVTPDTIDKDEKLRREKKFTVNIRNPETPLASLWALDLDPRKHQAADRGCAYSRQTASRSPTTASGSASAAVAESLQAQHHRGEPLRRPLSARHRRPAQIERLTNNAEVGEERRQLLARRAVDRVLGAGRHREVQHEEQPRVPPRGRAIAASRSASWATSFDGDVTVGFWSKDGSTIYFNEGIRATNQLMALDVQREHRAAADRGEGVAVGRPRRRHRRAAHHLCRSAPRRRRSSRSTSMQNASTRSSWRQLTDPNPQVRSFALGAAGRDHLEVEGRHDGRRRAGEAGRLPAGPALSADRRHPRRPGRRPTCSASTAATARRSTPAPGYAVLLPELSRLDQLRREAQDRHRRQLLRARLRRHHDAASIT